MRGASEPESFGALFARLADQVRALVKAELALFRTDFYRRLGRAKIGMLMCLVGAIMGQAAAVTFLVTLSFVLQPWIGRLGGAAVSVVLGIGLAIGLIRFGVRRLMLVVDDDPDDDGDRAKDSVSMDILFDRVRVRSQEARNQLIDTFGEAQARLHPQALVADLTDEIVDHAQAIAHRVASAIRIRPYKLGGAAFLAALVIFRSPLARLVDKISRGETSQPETSLKRKRAARPSRRRPGNNEEETPS